LRKENKQLRLEREILEPFCVLVLTCKTPAAMVPLPQYPPHSNREEQGGFVGT
jgi:hypothetical protein